MPNNKVLHCIKYKRDKYNKFPYFNSPIFDKDRKIISPIINVTELKSYFNEKYFNNFFKSIRHINQINISDEILNNTYDYSPRSLTDRANLNQTLGKTFDVNYEKNNKNYPHIKSEKEKTKSPGYIKIKTNEFQSNYEQSSKTKSMGEFTLLPKFKPINSDTKGHDFKKNNDFGKIFNKRLNDIIKRNDKSNNYIKHIIYTNNNNNSLEKDKYSKYYSLNINHEQKYQKKENHPFVSNSEIKKNKRNESIIINNIYSRDKINRRRKTDTALKDIRITRNKKNHVLYESKYLKSENLKENSISIIKKNNDKNENNNKENKNINESKKFTKKEKQQEIRDKLNNEKKNKNGKIIEEKIINKENKSKDDSNNVDKNEYDNIIDDHIKDFKDNDNKIIDVSFIDDNDKSKEDKIIYDKNKENKNNNDRVNEDKNIDNKNRNNKDANNNISVMDKTPNNNKNKKSNLNKLNKKKKSETSLNENIDSIIINELNENKISSNTADTKSYIKK